MIGKGLERVGEGLKSGGGTVGFGREEEHLFLRWVGKGRDKEKLETF